jgi:phospholipase/carboxylesterase
MSKVKLPYVELNPETAPKATVIFLHGLGADGHDFVPVVQQLGLPKQLAVRFIFPHAPERPITINGGYQMRAWYDIHGLDFNAREDESGILASAIMIDQLIQEESERGIPSDKIVLAGFSQGGALALHCGLRYFEPLAGILALSCYMPLAATLQANKSPANQNTPIFIAHGTQDSLVPFAWAELANNFLRENNYQTEFHQYPMPHSVCPQEITDISRWLQRVLG